MNINDRLTELEEHFFYWIGSYQRKDRVTNSVRIIGENVCKAIILNVLGTGPGARVITGFDPSLPSRVKITQPGQTLKFYELIQVLEDLRVFRLSRTMKLHLELIKDLTNPGSHSTNQPGDQATLDDLEVCYVSVSQLIKWLFSGQLNRTLPANISEALAGEGNSSEYVYDDEKWIDFLSRCADFEKRFQYIFVAPEKISDNPKVAQAIAKLPWRLVLDFNPKTDEESIGLLHNFNDAVGQSYKKSITIDDRPDFDPKFEHYWFLANGQGSILPIADFKSWRSKYKRFLGESLYKAFNEGSRARSRIVVLLNIPQNYAEAVIDEFNRVDEPNLRFILCSDGKTSYDYIFERYPNVESINISADQIAKGVEKTVSFSNSNNAEQLILIPTRTDIKQTTHLPFKREHYDYLQSIGIEVVYKGIENEPSDPSDENAFYKGATIAWKDLSQEKDVPRNALEMFEKRLLGELERNKTHEIELTYEAGGGGTTMARRLAFNICSKFPTVIIRRYEPKKTIGGLRIIYDQYTKGSLPLLIIMELYEVMDSGGLYRDLAHANKNAIILVVKRGSAKTTKDIKFFLRAQLDSNEVTAFSKTFTDLMPQRSDKILAIKNDYRDNSKYISPFLYGLVAYERDFNGVANYITKCLRDINLEQKKLVGFICLIYHFTQRSIPGELFTALLGTSRDKCDLVTVIGRESPVFELLHEDDDGYDGFNTWRPRYAIVGEETVKIILSGSVERRDNWESFLAQWMIDLIRYIKAAIPDLDGDAKQILDSLFISRIEHEAMEHRDQFTDLILKVKPSDGQAIFQELTNAYPDDAHFHGHFARYLYKDHIGIKDYDGAIAEANISLKLQGYDSTLIHTLGMCYKEKAEALISTYQDHGYSFHEAEERVKLLVEDSCAAFDHCIEVESQNVYGHESQIRVLLKALDFGFSQYSGLTKEAFISDPQNDWYIKKLDKINTLLDDANYIIDRAKGLENKDRLNRSAGYIEDCQNKLFMAIGKGVVAKDRFEHLIKYPPAGFQFMVPHYRRMYIKCLLASKQPDQKSYYMAWDKISESELNQAVDYLSDNIFEDPANAYNIRLWLQAVRFLKTPPTIEECIGKVSMWCQMLDQNTNSLLEGFYYLYVLNATKAISNGNTFDPTAVENVKALKERMKGFVKNEKFSFEWFGSGVGIQQLKNHHTLGDFGSDFFVRNHKNLAEVRGRIKEIHSSQSGTVILDCGLEAFFVPNANGYTEKNRNDRVKFYVGFRYDQLNAWMVIPNDDEREQNNQHFTLGGTFMTPVEHSRDSIEDRFKPLVEKQSFERHKTSPNVENLGEIDTQSTKKTNGEAMLSRVHTIPDEVYEGVIKSLKDPIGLITSTKLDREVTFHVTHLRNCRFHELKVGRPILFKLFFADGKPKLDKGGINYSVREVRIQK